MRACLGSWTYFHDENGNLLSYLIPAISCAVFWGCFDGILLTTLQTATSLPDKYVSAFPRLHCNSLPGYPVRLSHPYGPHDSRGNGTFGLYTIDDARVLGLEQCVLVRDCGMPYYLLGGPLWSVNPSVYASG